MNIPQDVVNRMALHALQQMAGNIDRLTALPETMHEFLREWLESDAAAPAVGKELGVLIELHRNLAVQAEQFMSQHALHLRTAMSLTGADGT